MQPTPHEALLIAIIRQAYADKRYTPRGSAESVEAQRQRRKNATEAKYQLDAFEDVFQRLEELHNDRH